MVLNFSKSDINITIVENVINVTNNSGMPIEFNEILEVMDAQMYILHQYAKGYSDSTQDLQKMDR